MEPTVERVIEAVQEMLARPWPSGDDLGPWLRWHHLEGARANGSGALLDWGDASGVLNHHEGQFVGINLFLWSSSDPVELIDRFRRLGEAFDLLLGEAVERWGPTGQPAALWKGARHTVQLYPHTGAGPCLQLAVDDTALADAAEADARARHDATAHPLAALGSPADTESFAVALDQAAELRDTERE